MLSKLCVYCTVRLYNVLYNKPPKIENCGTVSNTAPLPTHGWNTAKIILLNASQPVYTLAAPFYSLARCGLRAPERHRGTTKNPRRPHYDHHGLFPWAVLSHLCLSYTRTSTLLHAICITRTCGSILVFHKYEASDSSSWTYYIVKTGTYNTADSRHSPIKNTVASDILK